MTGTSAAPGPLRLPSDQDASGRSLGDEEVALLREVIESGVLTSTKGTKVRAFEERFAEMLGVPHAIACSSGTAAVHSAIAAIDPEPGDEIVTTAITDMGALTPILYQGAIPVFADVDPSTVNVTAQTIEAVLSERTRAIIVTHLFGMPCDLGPIEALARSEGIPLVEDCAQAFLARSAGRAVGTVGRLGCFSLQQGKHITVGEGGVVVTSDAEMAHRMRRFVNKAWDYDSSPTDHDFIALNYRLTELQGAVALAQLGKLAGGVERRIANATRLDAALRDLPGISVPRVGRADVHSYWRYAVHVDPAVVPGGPAALAAELKLEGIASAPRYIQKPAFRCGVFANQQTFGTSRWPFTLARPQALEYDESHFPGTIRALERLLVLPWNERYAEGDVDHLAGALSAAVERLCGEGA